MAKQLERDYAISVVRMPDGKRIPIQVDSATGIPVVGDNVWIITERSQRKSVETILADLTVSAIIRCWTIENDVNLAFRFETETFLSHIEINSLTTKLRERRRREKKSSSKVVSDQTWRKRFDAASVYFKYLAIRYGIRSSPYATNQPFNNFMKAWANFQPRNSSRSRLGLTHAQISLILSVTKPSHEQNPWHQRTQSRNRLVVLLMLLCGLRLGEVLSLRMQDLAARGSFPTIDIRKRPPDKFETRRIPPTPKTLGRRLPLPGSVAIALNNYVLNDRACAPGNQLQPFLILSQHGRPCSKESVQALISVLRGSNPLLDGIVAHRFRNSFTDLAQEALKISNLNKEQGTDILAYMGGWTKTSKQPGKYSQLWIDAQVDEVISLVHNTAFGIES